MANGTDTFTVDDYVKGVLAGNRSMLARAITLIESAHPDHHALAQQVLIQLLPHSGKADRIGITGVPGVGKSTFIDAFGTNLTAAGHKVAVLAVDPSSTRSGGSILGDKTRMARLAADPNAYIRPSPTSGKLGGVARATREAMMLCEAAGFDIILVETVGAGQSETEVAGMVDFFLVLMLPTAGDELQGIKKGVLELADMAVVNKADIDEKQARRAVRDYKAAIHIITPPGADWIPPVLPCSGLKNDGLDVIRDKIADHKTMMVKNGRRDEKRRTQRIRWMWSLVEDQMLARLKSNASIRKQLPALEKSVADGDLTAGLAAEKILAAFWGRAD